MSGEAQQPTGDCMSVAGPSGMAPDPGSSTPSGTVEKSPHHRECATLEKVKSDVDKMRDAYLTFLGSALLVIDDDLFPLYFETVTLITRKYVELSLARAREHSQLAQVQPEDPHEVLGSDGVGGGQPASPESPSEEMQEQEEGFEYWRAERTAMGQWPDRDNPSNGPRGIWTQQAVTLDLPDGFPESVANDLRTLMRPNLYRAAYGSSSDGGHGGTPSGCNQGDYEPAAEEGGVDVDGDS